MRHALRMHAIDFQLPRLGWGFSNGLLDRAISVYAVSHRYGFSNHGRMYVSNVESIILQL